MICFNSVPVDNGLVQCGFLRQHETVENIILRTQGKPICKDSIHIGFSGLYTSSTASSTTTLFFFNSSKH